MIPFSADGAFLIGVSGAVSQIDLGDAGSSTISYYGGVVAAGLAVTPSPNVACEFVAQGGFGLCSGDHSESSHYGKSGLAFRPVLSHGMIELFAERGYFWQDQKLDIDGDGSRDLKASGAQAGFGAGLSF